MSECVDAEQITVTVSSSTYSTRRKQFQPTNLNICWEISNRRQLQLKWTTGSSELATKSS